MLSLGGSVTCHMPETQRGALSSFLRPVFLRSTCGEDSLLRTNSPYVGGSQLLSTNQLT